MPGQLVLRFEAVGARYWLALASLASTGSYDWHRQNHVTHHFRLLLLIREQKTARPELPLPPANSSSAWKLDRLPIRAPLRCTSGW